MDGSCGKREKEGRVLRQEAPSPRLVFSYFFPSARASDMMRKTSVLFMKPRKASA